MTWKIGNIESPFKGLFWWTCPSTKGGDGYYIEWLQNNKQNKNKVILCLYTQWKSMKRWRILIHRMITKQWVKNEQIKRKQTGSFCFVNVLKFQENKFKVIQNNFWEIKIMLIKKDSVEMPLVTMIITW